MRHRWGLERPLRVRALAALVFLGGCGVALAQGQGQQPPEDGRVPVSEAEQPQAGQQAPVGTTVVEVEVQGPAAQVRGQCPELQFTLGGFTVSTDARTEFDDGRCEDLSDGTPVEVEGVTGAEGQVTAREVDLD